MRKKQRAVAEENETNLNRWFLTIYDFEIHEIQKGFIEMSFHIENINSIDCSYEFTDQMHKCSLFMQDNYEQI